eukprot:SAG31_NODE_31386_length_368_cov_68.245353_1_plen_42_part_10
MVDDGKPSPKPFLKKGRQSYAAEFSSVPYSIDIGHTRGYAWI